MSLEAPKVASCSSKSSLDLQGEKYLTAFSNERFLDTYLFRALVLMYGQDITFFLYLTSSATQIPPLSRTSL